MATYTRREAAETMRTVEYALPCPTTSRVVEDTLREAQSEAAAGGAGQPVTVRIDGDHLVVSFLVAAHQDGPAPNGQPDLADDSLDGEADPMPDWAEMDGMPSTSAHVDGADDGYTTNPDGTNDDDTDSDVTDTEPEDLLDRFGEGSEDGSVDGISDSSDSALPDESPEALRERLNSGQDLAADLLDVDDELAADEAARATDDLESVASPAAPTAEDDDLDGFPDPSTLDNIPDDPVVDQPDVDDIDISPTPPAISQEHIDDQAPPPAPEVDPADGDLGEIIAVPTPDLPDEDDDDVPTFGSTSKPEPPATARKPVEGGGFADDDGVLTFSVNDDEDDDEGTSADDIPPAGQVVNPADGPAGTPPARFFPEEEDGIADDLPPMRNTQG